VSDYFDDGLFDEEPVDEGGYTLDPELLDEMARANAEAQAAGQAAFDQQLDEFEARWEVEDQQRAAEQEAADAEAATEDQVAAMFTKAAGAAGISDEVSMTKAIVYAEGLLADPDWLNLHPVPGPGQVEAAIGEAMQLVSPADEGDELDVATRFMTRRRAEAGYFGDLTRAQENAEAALEILATVGNEDVRNPELRAAVGLAPLPARRDRDAKGRFA
jgi:hypothetical protein